eukprot:g2648.t1
MEAPRQMEARQQLMSIQELSEELEAAKNSLQEKESQLYGAWDALREQEVTISKLSEELRAVKNSLRDKEAQVTAAWCSLQEKDVMINKLSNELEAAKKTSDMRKQLEPTTKPSPRRPARKRRVSSSASDEEVIVTEMRVMGEMEDEEQLDSGGEGEMPEEIDKMEDEEEMAEEVDWMQEKMEAINEKMGELLEEDVQNLRSFTFENAAREARKSPFRWVMSRSNKSTVKLTCSMCNNYQTICEKNGLLLEGEPAVVRFTSKEGFTSGNFDHICLKAIERSRTVVAAHPDRNLLPYFFWDMQGTKREMPDDLKNFKQQQNLTIRNEKRSSKDISHVIRRAQTSVFRKWRGTGPDSTVYAGLPHFKVYLEYLDQDTRFQFHVRDGFYDRCIIIPGSIIRANKVPGLKPVISLDAATPKPLGEMRVEGKLYIATMVDGASKTHVAAIGHDGNESEESWYHFLSLLQASMRVATAHPEMADEGLSTRGGRVASLRQKFSYIMDEHSGSKAAMEKLDLQDLYSLCIKHKAGNVARIFGEDAKKNFYELVKIGEQKSLDGENSVKAQSII